jgi:hypothetical protein
MADTSITFAVDEDVTLDAFHLVVKEWFAPVAAPGGKGALWQQTDIPGDEAEEHLDEAMGGAVGIDFPGVEPRC